MANAMILPKQLPSATVEDEVIDEPVELSVDSLNRGEREEAGDWSTKITISSRKLR